ncbi:MAG: phospholipase, partial [Pseudomonadales bacterium]|nr:phospholipase [Pseudomonadales bacterium]
MSEGDDRLVNAITRLIPTLLTTMEAFEQVQRNMHPPRLEQLAGLIQPYEASLNDALEEFRPLEFPEHLSPFRERVVHAAEYALRACNGIINHESGFGAVMKAMRAQCRAQELIYPLAPMMSPVNQYFLEPAAREDAGLIKQLSEGAENDNTGIINADNDRKQRGGFTLYVPENAGDEPLSLVVALHGGTGHGADFLWSWLREARTRKFLLMAPTSRQDTWSLMGEEHDLPGLLAMLDYVKSRWTVD